VLWLLIEMNGNVNTVDLGIIFMFTTSFIGLKVGQMR
jgi:hypothetical protein